MFKEGQSGQKLKVIVETLYYALPVCVWGGEEGGKGDIKQIKCLMREGKLERFPTGSTHLLRLTLKAFCDLAQPTCPSANSIHSFSDY